MSIEHEDWLPLQFIRDKMQRKHLPAMLPLPGLQISEALEDSRMDMTDVDLSSPARSGPNQLFYRRIKLKSKKYKGKVLIEIARRADIEDWLPDEKSGLGEE